MPESAWSASPRSPRWPDQIPCLVPHTGNRASVIRGSVSIRRGSEESGTNARFLGWGLRHQAPTSRPIRVLVAGARSESSMGPRRRSRGRCPPRRMKPRNGRPSFALIRNGRTMGQHYHRVRRENRSRVGKGRPAGSIELRVSPSPSKIPYGGFSPVRLQVDRQMSDLRRHPEA